MIFLVLKMFVYLLVALAAGGAAGWLLRNLAASKREEDMQRVVNETKSRVPQFESLMRGRDDQIKKLKYEIEAKQKELGETHQSLRDAEHEARENSRELKTLQHRHQALASGSGEGALIDGAIMGDSEAVDYAQSSGEGEAPVAELHQEIARLKSELESAKLEILQLDAMQGTPQAASGESVEGDENLRRETLELQARLKQKAEEHNATCKALDKERGKVVELERERELQNKSLQVLHQQLEIERERMMDDSGGHAIH